MPWPMVHFAVSEELTSGKASPSLLLGSIAPDAIHARGDITKEEKGTTHLVHNGKLPAAELILEKCKEYLGKSSVPEWKDFVLGYFSHIYTDLRWTETVYFDFEKKYKAEQNEIRNMYNREVSQVEFILLRSMRSSEEMISKIINADGFTIHPYVTELEVNQYRDIKVEWLQDQRNEPQITPVYFQMDEIEHFIKVTASEWKQLFEEAYGNALFTGTPYWE